MTKQPEKPKPDSKSQVKKVTNKVKKATKKSAKDSPKPKRKAQAPRKAGKRKRSDAISTQVEIAQAAFREIEPPEHVKLLKAEYVFWDSIISKIPKYEWEAHDLELAAMLARYMYALDKCQRKLNREGEQLDRKTVIPATEDAPAQVVVTGTYANPLKGFIKMYHENVLSIRRSLALHATGEGVKTRDVQSRRDAAKKIEDGVNDDDDLFAKPPTSH